MPIVAILLNWLHQLMLAVWLGGIATLAVSAPAIFREAKNQGQTNWSMPLYHFAGMAVTSIFQRFTLLCVVAGGLMLFSGIAYGGPAGLCRRRLTVRAALTALAWLIVLYLQFGLLPEMLHARDSGDMSAFDALHKTSSHLFSAQLLLLVTVAALTSWMHLDLSPHGIREGSLGREVVGSLGDEKPAPA
jgi:hypothetical protein